MGRCVFNDSWPEHEEFKDWISRGADKFHARCTACRQNLKLGTQGKKSLQKHAQTAKHRKSIRRVVSEGRERAAFVQSFAPTNQIQSQPQVQRTAQPTSTQQSVTLVSKDTMKAEILWVLRTVVRHQSYSSNAEIGKLFALMFPDSDIAKAFQCGRDKTAYLSKFGLAPHFTKLVEDDIRKAGEFVLMFDESLNNVTGSKQLDVHIRFWSADQVQSRYYTSKFMGHATAADLFDTLQVGY